MQCDQINFDRFVACKKCKELKPKKVVTEPTPSTSQMSKEPTPSLQISPTIQSSDSIESSPDERDYEGKRGTKCIVEANYISIDCENLLNYCFHYIVTFTFNNPKNVLTSVLDKFMRTTYKDYLYGFDGRRNMYTNRKLTNIGNTQLQVRSQTFGIKIKYDSLVDMGDLLTYKNPQKCNINKPHKAIQAFNIILKSENQNNIYNGSIIPIDREKFRHGL